MPASKLSELFSRIVPVMVFLGLAVGSAAAAPLESVQSLAAREKTPLLETLNGEILVHVYCRATESEALEENVLTEGEARQLAIDVAKLSALMRREE
jgi:hypothetical protein